MARDARRSAERFKYGICLNDECPKCKSKEVQQIPLRKDLVCSECCKELRECPPPKKMSMTPLIAGAAFIVVAGIVGCIFAFSGKKDNNDKPEIAEAAPIVEIEQTEAEIIPEAIEEEPETTVSETPKAEPATTAQREAANSGSGTLKLSYGTYSGATKGGYPHGQGKLTYSTTRQINRNDTKARTAKPGDYVIGEFFNGFVVYGKHYDASGNLLGSLNFGVGSESSYDSK